MTRAQVRAIDRLATGELGIPSVVLMENAGRGAAEEILAALDEGRLAARGASRPCVLVLCGAGNNAGDGYVVARHLAIAGLAVQLVETVEPERSSEDAAIFRRVACAMGIPHRLVRDASAWERERAELESADLVVDALLGTGFRGELREPLAGIVRAADDFARAGQRSVVALDVPSGLDADTGVASNAVVRAELTLTFAAQKIGLARPEAREYVGELRVIGIGTPPALLERARREF